MDLPAIVGSPLIVFWYEIFLLKFNVLCYAKTATDHGHLFWIEDGSIRSDINLHDSVTVDLNLQNTRRSSDHLQQRSITSISSLEDGLIASKLHFEKNSLPYRFHATPRRRPILQ